VLQVLNGCVQFRADDRFEDMDELDEHLEIAEQELLQSMGRTEHAQMLASAHVAHREAFCQQESLVIEEAFHSALRSGNWRLSEYLLSDMQVLNPESHAIAHYQDLLQRKKTLARKTRYGFFVLLILIALAFVGYEAWHWKRSSDPLAQLETRLVKNARMISSTEQMALPVKRYETRRLISIPEEYVFDRFWVDSIQQPLENGVLQLHPGSYHVVGRLRGSIELRRGHLEVPEKGPVRWKWKEP